MYNPPRLAAVPTAEIVRRAYLSSLWTLLFLLPLTLFVLTGHTAAAADVCTTGSDPSGCITAYRYNTGRLEVRKVLRPSDNPGRFNLLIDDTILASAIGDGGTTGEQIVRAGQHSVSETTAIGTSLADYNTSVECRDANGTGSVVASQANNSPLSLMVPAGSDIVCTITNERQTGTIYVTKVVDWNGSPPHQGQTFEICVYGISYPNGSCKTVDYDGGLLTWPGVETGDYDVVETNPGSAWSVVVDSSPVTVPCGGEVSATVTNTLRTGSLEVIKTVNWSGTTPDPAKTFAICITGPSYGAPNCQNADFDGGTLLWPNLIPGDYVVSESEPGSGWSVKVTNSPATVPAGGPPAQASVVNTRRLGSLEVTKTVDWNGAPEDTAQSFQICITGPSFPAGNCQTVGSSGGKLLWENLIPAPYVVSETDPGSMWTVEAPNAAITVPDDGSSAKAAVLNAHKVDSLAVLTVTKTVDWNGVTPDPNQSFTICVTGPSYPESNCQNTGYLGGVLSWADLLPGAYTVSETDIGQLWTTVINGSPVTIGSGNGEATATVVNTRKLGSLEVTKTVDWNGAPENASQSFQICITGPSYPAGNCQTVGSSGGKLLWEGLIPAPYVISEIDPGSMWTVDVPNGPVTVPGDGAGAKATVVNTHKFGSLEVTKVVDWIGVPVDPTQTFQICITGPSYPAGNCQTVGSNGGMLVWNNLIPGPYRVSETDPGIVWVVAVPDGPITVPGDGKATATVLNTHKGTLDVEKFVIWNGLPEDPSQSFQLCITGPSYPNGNCQTVGSSGGHLFWYNLIPGPYVISEIDPGNMWTVEVPDGPVTVPECDCGEARAAVFNTRKLGSLTVTKTVDWNGAPPDPNQSFTICIAGPSNTDGDCKSVGADGGVLTWPDLIPGNYSVTENNPGPLWETVITGSPAAVPEDGGQASAAVINRLVSSGAGQNPVQKPGGAFRVYLPSLGY